MKAGEDNLRGWLRVSHADLLAARHLVAGGLWEAACFHCQQTVEKLLKAYLVARGTEPPRIHDLTTLLDVCAGLSASFAAKRDQWEWLTGFAVTIRYPTEVEPPDREEATRALTAAEACWEAVLAEMPPELRCSAE